MLVTTALLATITTAVVGIKAGTRLVIKSPGIGGTGGKSFDDLATNLSIVNVYQFFGYESDIIQAIQVIYQLSNGSHYYGPGHGSKNNPYHIYACSGSEGVDNHTAYYITKIEGSTNGSIITYLNLRYESVSQWRAPYYSSFWCGNYGAYSTKNFSFEGVILGFHGRAGQLLDNIGVYSLALLNKSKEFGGGSGGGRFDDEMNNGFPPLTGISTLYIWHGDHINAIQAYFWQLGDVLLWGDKHGGDGGEKTAVTFEKGEQIIEFHGEYDECISKVHFITQKNGGRKTFYGPFGKPGKTTFAFFGKVFGFHGHARDNMINKIGFYHN